ncbi:ABC transporter permease [Brevibacillus sp. SYP-B805]|uniref:ABC transporter permease n=1 Tax=Brevibacillus sp. SYP-B805 TaxID=1578199 RepID=UPI0013EBCC6F|nr:ABC transporter permease [Brevibacillus sp. SYP-B805]NGQ94971.1 ABC transporter permease [Brevibacillus sp. SYP-B805]
MRGKIAERLIRACLFLVVIAFLGWAFATGAFQFMLDNLDDLLHLLQQHLKLVGLSSLLAVVAAVPIGILVTRPRFKKFDWLAVNAANIGQTVPSLAILALVMTYLGIGYVTAVFALWLYSLLPILRNTIAGIESINPSIIDAGQGMGMTPSQILWKLEIPNALFAILAGIRTSIVINVGTAALAFLIGGGGLGDLIFTGISLNDTGIMLSGALPVTLLAILLDVVLGKMEKWIIPKGLQRHLET